MSLSVSQSAGTVSGQSAFTDFSTRHYAEWRKQKLALREKHQPAEPVQLSDPLHLSKYEKAMILASLAANGYVIYRLQESGNALEANDLLALCSQLGLNRLNNNRCAWDDGVTRLQVDSSGERKHYIPYTSKRLNWHTDGYYNDTPERIRAFALHCVRNAEAGGESLLFDPEMLYLLLRDENPEWVKVLFEEDVLVIPENAVNVQNLRKEQAGPVFWLDEKSGGLQMRYTARTRSIFWKDNPLVKEAVEFIRQTLESSSLVAQYKLQAGEGVISNNCLHARQGFAESDDNSKGRLLYRARFFDRIDNGNPRVAG